MKRKLIILTALLVFVATAQAKVDPYVEDPAAEWGDLAEPVSIWSPFSAAVHAGTLAEAEDIDAFTLEFDEPAEAWSFEIIVPLCGQFEAFFPSIALIGPGLDAPQADTLPFDLPDEMGAVIFSEDEYLEQYADEDERPTIHSNYATGDPAYANTRHEFDIPEAGEYTLVVFEPSGIEGAYMLQTGSVHDQFASRPNGEREKAFDLFFSGEWMGEACEKPAAA